MAYFFFLNISSIRSVTIKPPTTFTVAKTMARNPRIPTTQSAVDSGSNRGRLPVIKTAPMRVIPEMAFAPDIKGVCRVGGTLDISSNPTNEANTKTKRLKIKSIGVI